MELTSEFVQTEIGTIPSDWSLHSFGDLVEYTKGFAFRSADYEENGIRIIRVSDTTYDGIKQDRGIYVNGSRAAEFSKWTLRESDLIFSTVGSKPPMYDSMVGKVVIVAKQYAGCLLNQNAVLIRSKSGCPFAQRLIFDQCKTKRYLRHIEAIYRGNANQASITLVDLFGYKVAMPDKPEEQRAIAEALSDVDALINALDALITKKRHIKQGTMQQLLTGKKRLPGFAKSNEYVNTEIGSIPADWSAQLLDDLTDRVTNGFVGRAKDHYDETGNGVLYVQGYNVKPNAFDFHGIKKVTQSFHSHHAKSCLRPGDLLTVQTGDCGVTAVVPESLAGANCHALIISRLKRTIAYPNFYGHYFNSEECMQRFQGIETGTTMKHLNVGDMKALLFPVPSSLDEQTAIAEVLLDMDAEITALEQKRDKTKLIKQGMMQVLLTGQVRLVAMDNE